MNIILDAGHGGINPKTQLYVTKGKRSLRPIDGKWYYEGVENRLIVKEWATILENLGHKVFYTVDPNDYIDVSLTERVRRANEIHKEHNAFLISVHSNGFHKESANGHEVFTCPDYNDSDRFAKLWGDRYRIKFPDHAYRYGKKRANDKEELFTIIAGNRHIKPNYNSMLIELAFHTNPDDVRLLRSWEYRMKTGILLAQTANHFQ